MPDITLELLLEPRLDYAQLSKIELPAVVHVHKRIERFIYQRFVRDSSTPIAHIRNPNLTPRRNLALNNKTYLVPANTPLEDNSGEGYSVITGKALSSQYEKVLITDKTALTSTGKLTPLWWKHKLPPGTVSSEVLLSKRGSRLPIENGFSIDYQAGYLYTNYRNHYNQNTGSHRLFYVVSTTDTGQVAHELLNPQPAVQEATLDDIDLETGTLSLGVDIYSVSKSSSGYTFFLSRPSTWYYRPMPSSYIQPELPTQVNASEPWFLNFTAGSFSASVNGQVRSYFVPEYDLQPYVPYKPFVYTPKASLRKVNRKILYAQHRNLAIDPQRGMHLSLLFRDPEGVPVRVLTTDKTLDGVRYGNSDLFYSAEEIVHWDNQGGFIQLSTSMQRDWIAEATYYRKAEEYTYTLVDLNPHLNKKALSHTYVFYLLPNIPFGQRAIHHLVVNSNGIIIECSQSLALNTPNLQLLNSDNSFNPNTVIGMRYSAENEDLSFSSKFTAGYTNDFGYVVLAEVTALDTAILEDQRVVDVRRVGGVIKENRFEATIKKNPKILQSILGYGEQGQEVPMNGIVYVTAPITLLKEFGGDLTETEAKKLLGTHMPSAGHLLIDWDYPATEISVVCDLPNEVIISCSWEGPDLTYRLYRKTSPAAEWEMIDSLADPAEGSVIFSDAEVLSGVTYYYCVKLFDGTYEYPARYNVGIKVK